ncbi:protein of unknown function [Candidatus Nitrosocosmicus franklandus]|uniref:Uncharacterized protein n=1 Tax=Candidatus Nitrosocosmicus franklandianus TaxID=1798806 RepID=A0A484IAN9_9ARCH|nr:protein of unknown function [Candidatus Nitrosocosmicus franklandus]
MKLIGIIVFDHQKPFQTNIKDASRLGLSISTLQIPNITNTKRR